MRTAFEREGDMRSVDLLGAFAALWRERASGVVDFSGPGRAVRFDVSDGEIVAVTSSDQSFETAGILQRAERLSEEALADGRIPTGSDRARYLRDIGLLSDRDWRWGEKLRIVEILSGLVGWLDGTYRHDPAATLEPSDFRIGIHRVVLELYLRSSDRAFIHHSLGAPDASLVRAADFDEDFASLGLTSDALAVAAAIDGKATAAEISRHTPPDPFSVEKLLAALATLGLVHPEYALEAPTYRESSPKPEPPQPTPEPSRVPEPEPVLEPEPEPASVARELEPPPAVLPEIPPVPPEPPVPVDDLELFEMPSPRAPSEPDSAVPLWQNAPAEPLDQPLEVVEPPDFGAPHRPWLSPIWLPLLLAAAVGAILLLRTREPSPTSRAVLSASPAGPPPETTEPRVPTEAAALPVLPTVVSIPPTVVPSSTAALRPSPRPTPVVSRPMPAVPAAPGTRTAWLALAQRDRRRLTSDSRTRFSIQLELVCELPSLEEAWVYDRQGAMWLLTASHQGRTCFRVFWGRYRTLEEARSEKSSVPAFFFTPKNQPVVVSTTGALLR